MGERNLGRFAAVIFATLACAMVLGSPASAGDRLSKSEAHQATMKRASEMGATRIYRCVRHSRQKFRCRTETYRQSDDGTITSCRRIYSVKAAEGGARVRLISRRCTPIPPAGPPPPPDIGPQTGPGPKYCPSTKKTCDSKPELEGKTYEVAVPIEKAHGCSIRILKIDGAGQLITDDFSWYRIDVAVEGPDQLITEVIGVF